MTTSPTASVPARGAGLAGVLEIARRRRLLAVVPFLFVLAGAASLAFFLPGLWTARSLIMVDRPQVPESMVKSTVVSDLEGQLISVSQEIMSRPRLAAIIQRYNLYPRVRQSLGMDEAVDRMRKDIKLEIQGDAERRRAREPRTMMFTVAYGTNDPRVAMNVTNQLTALYVEENVKLREKVAAGTSEFLERQLGEARTKLQQLEQRIAAYKEQHMGELPEQREANFRALERLQQQLTMANENNRRASERRQLITQSLADIDQSVGLATAGGGVAGPDVTPQAAAAARLNLLKQELVQMQSTYNDKYPDVVALKDQIRALEAKIAQDAPAASPAPAPVRPKGGRELKVAPQNPYIVSLMQQLDQATVESKASADEIGGVNRQIAMYQRRIENTPRREQELSLITRDYETTRDLFRSLLSKRDEAGMAADLEAKNKGERFRIIEGAGMPERPTGPNRLRLLMVGLVLALAAGAVAVVLAEQVDTSYRTVDEVRASVPVPVLSTIPKITTERDRHRTMRQRRWAAAAVAVGLFVVVGSSFVVAHNNDTLVALLTPSDRPAAGR